MTIKFVNNKFVGKINSKCATDYYNQARNVKYGSVEERIEQINKILGTEKIGDYEFYDDYWTKVFYQNDEDEYEGGIKLILNKDDSLYSESNIASTLELMGTMIIRGETKKDNPEGYTRVFHSREMFKKELNEQEKLRTIVTSTSDGKYAMTNGVNEYFVLSNQMNYKMEKKWTQLDDEHLKKLCSTYGGKYPQVLEYHKGYLSMKSELDKYKKIKETRELTRDEKREAKVVTKHIRGIKEDLVDCIYAKVRPIVFKCPLPDKGEPSWEIYDDTDPKHIRALLNVSKGNDLTHDVSVMVRDLENTIKECDFTDKQREVLILFRKDKTQEYIGNILGIDSSGVNRHINAIANKIANKNMEKLENWYYMNIRYGEYKRCTKCGEIKLTSRFNKNGNGYRSMCKECIK